MSSGQQVLLKLRKMIISGELEGGARIAEIPTAELLGVSRQPVRIAFRLLEQEGLLIKNPTRGYTVREISEQLVHDALEVRGVLEGLAAKTLAEQGLSEEQKRRYNIAFKKLKNYLMIKTSLVMLNWDVITISTSFFMTRLLKARKTSHSYKP